MSAIDRFKDIAADYWDCSDAEPLSYDSPVEALEVHLDGWLSPGCDTEAILRGLGPVEIVPWHRKVIAPDVAPDFADDLFEYLQQKLEESDEYGDPDGEHLFWSAEQLGKHKPALVAVVQALLADADVWQCDRGQALTLSVDEVLELMRAACPEWFETDAAAPTDGAP